MKTLPAIAVTLALGLMISDSAIAQQGGEHMHHADAVPSDRWTLIGDGNVFFGFNEQRRKFLDASAWESQNWLMGSAAHALGRGRLTLMAMLSLEPFTMHARGSPQLFQTGETYQRIPLVNYQHPHDLLMGLGATYRQPYARGAYYIGVDLVGSPTLGPTAFMHRESARDNPQAPLSHHVMDSTHITPGVVRGGVDVGPVTFESSAFRGAEPDENRLNIERPQLDSWAARVQYRHGPWQAQVSGGHLHQPEWFEPYDVTRLTASISFGGNVHAMPLNATIAWGEDREFNGFNGNHDGYLAEWDLRARRSSTIFGRAEVVDKEPFPTGAHPPGDVHPHFFFRIHALTTGYVHEIHDTRCCRIGVGADITVYRMPEVLQQFWGGSYSYHVFLRWRPGVGAGHVH